MAIVPEAVLSFVNTNSFFIRKHSNLYIMNSNVHI